MGERRPLSWDTVRIQCLKEYNASGTVPGTQVNFTLSGGKDT